MTVKGLIKALESLPEQFNDFHVKLIADPPVYPDYTGIPVKERKYTDPVLPLLFNIEADRRCGVTLSSLLPGSGRGNPHASDGTITILDKPQHPFTKVLNAIPRGKDEPIQPI